jgi:hypothetical protein
MKRRAFVKNTTLATAGFSIILTKFKPCKSGSTIRSRQHAAVSVVNV